MPELTEEERERVKDSKHNIQTAAAALSGIDPRRLPKLDEVEECLENAEKALGEVLHAAPFKEHPTRRPIREQSVSGFRS